jgi:hypothetical protein
MAAARRPDGLSPSAKPCISQHEQNQEILTLPKFGSYLTENTSRLNYKSHCLNVVKEMTKGLTPRNRAILEALLAAPMVQKFRNTL